jgi:glycosyltransferase involved in cell wall biosynthesis
MNKKKIDISIIITTFNRVDNIIKIINSFQKQINITKNFEIIICDSNSKNKLRIINYINQFINLKIKYLNCPVNHQAYKRNFGAKHSSGDYLIFIDDDEIPTSTWFEALVASHRSFPADVIFGPVLAEPMVIYGQMRDRVLVEHKSVSRVGDSNFKA